MNGLSGGVFSGICPGKERQKKGAGSLRASDLIRKKRDGGELSTVEINTLIRGYTGGDIPDYQMAAFLMAVFFRGMSRAETADFTRAMVESGERCDLSDLPGVKVDKHSTGGVGDKTTLILAPLVAAAGVPVAKMSGRGLGHTGGTVDKLESIPGYRSDRSLAEMKAQVRTVGVAVVSQTGDLTPADKLLYSLRDVTATVDCIPLIAASVMSKKIASGADAVLLDVKAGSGAFMKKPADALRLARTMVEIGADHGVRTAALVTNMEQPLGRNVGNLLEVKEAVEVLRGHDPAPDLAELVLALGSRMVVLGERAADETTARRMLDEIWRKGRAYAKFCAWMAAQGGDAGFLDRPTPPGISEVAVYSREGGYVTAIDAEKVGRAAMVLGAGRSVKDAPIDPNVGLRIHKKIGDPVEPGAVLGILSSTGRGEKEAAALYARAYRFGARPPAPAPLIYYRVAPDGAVTG